MAGHEPGEGRRIAAVFLPELLCEIASTARAPGAKRRERPIGVVLLDGAVEAESSKTATEDTARLVKPTSRLDAVNLEAHQFGVREGQSIAEACVILSELAVRSVTTAQVHAALARVAEIALAFGPTVALELPDTVWVDVSGAAHLFGGEAALAAELVSRVRAIGHVTRVAIASGPRLARAFARWQPVGGSSAGEPGTCVIAPEDTASAFAQLPLSALPIDTEHTAWLVRLGVLCVGDLARLPRAPVAARLGDRASAVLELCAGRDREPLTAYAPPAVLIEQTEWDEGANGIEPLLFVLRGLAARMSARLSGRGESARHLRVVITCDAAIARMQDAPREVVLDFELAVPLWREQELGRVISARLERQALGAPSMGLRLEASNLTPAHAQQLDLSRVAAGLTTGCRGLETLPVLLAELSADLGKDRVGVLALCDSQRPENKAELVPALSALRKSTRRSRARVSEPDWPNAPTRLFREPIPVQAVLRVGATLVIDHRLYSVESMCFEQRLDAVEWWSSSAASRDYFRLWLQHPSGGMEAIVYVDRESGQRFLQAVGD